MKNIQKKLNKESEEEGVEGYELVAHLLVFG